MLFGSPHGAMDFKIRSELTKRHPVTGDIIETKPAIHAVFGRWSNEQGVLNPVTGGLEQHADLTGHFFDSDEWASSRNPLGDPKLAKTIAEEKAMVERVLLQKCKDLPGMIWLIEKTETPAPLPWPNYNRLEADQIGPAAITFEAVPEALLYERENAKRPLVLDALEAALKDAGKPLPVKEAVYADGALDLPEATGLVLAGAPKRTAGGITEGRAGMPV